MSLADRLEAAKAAPRPAFEVWIDGLSASDRDALMAAAGDPAWSHRALYDAVKAEGAKVGKESLTNWRKAHGFPRG